MSPCPTKIYVKAWKFRIFDATEGYRVKYASVKSACYQWGPWFCVLYPILFQTWPELQAPSTTQQSILVLGLVLISSGDGGPLQSGCLVSVLLASASLHSLTKKVLRCHAKKRILCFRFVLSLNLQPYVIVILSQCVSAALQTQCSGHCCTAIWLHNATKKFTINTYRRTSARSMRAANISHLQCGMQLLKLRKGSG